MGNSTGVCISTIWIGYTLPVWLETQYVKLIMHLSYQFQNVCVAYATIYAEIANFMIYAFKIYMSRLLYYKIYDLNIVIH